MNILVVGGGAWVDSSSLGNTFSNFFGGWGEDTKFFNLYFRGTLPQNDVCEKYFSITDISIVRNFFCPHKIGRRVFKSEKSISDKVATNEKRIISFIHKFGATVAYEIEDMLWETDKWKNDKLDKFIEEAAPDIIFTFATGNSNVLRSVEYIKGKTDAKLVVFIADDIYNGYAEKTISRRERVHKKICELFDISDLIYGISEEICKKYSALFGKDVFELKKSCVSFSPIKKDYNYPLKIVYAGNLLYGRAETILRFSEEIKKINKDGRKIIFEIYSGTLIDSEIKKILSENSSCKFMGERSFSEIKKILEKADIVLHVESFFQENINLVKYSFSTKIIDCLQSGNIIMAIGPKESSSINYVHRIPGAYVACGLKEIESVLEEIINDGVGNYVLRSKQIRDFAIKYHNAEQNRKRLKKDFLGLIK